MSESVSGPRPAVAGGLPIEPPPPFRDPRSFVKHRFEERTADLGEVTMNYAVTGSPSNPALLLIPGQTESWWGYEEAMSLLEKDFQVYAIDLRGQGRSSWTPSRYTLDNMGNDLVRFIALVIKRPVITSGCSSGGLLSCWLSAFAMPGQLRGAVYEDAPFFSSETTPLYGQSIKQSAGPFFRLMMLYLGNQWSVNNWQGLREAASRDASPLLRMRPFPEEPAQNLKEYDPEWGRAFWEGTVAKSCPHERMLSQVKVPALLTHHARFIDPGTGNLIGALSDVQAHAATELVKKAGANVDYVSLPDAAHAMHFTEPKRFVQVVTEWAARLPG